MSQPSALRSTADDDKNKELDVKFKKCVAFLQNLPPDGPFQPSNSEKLTYYALSHQATFGPNTSPKPSVVDVTTRAKWEHWAKLGNTPKEQAKQRYISTVLESCHRNITPESATLIKEIEGHHPTKVTLEEGGAALPTYVPTPPNVLQIYADMMSQPSRAVIWFCILTKIPHEVKVVNIMKGEHLKQDFEKLNPFKKLPTVVDTDGFVMYESHSIMRYLASKYKVDEQWFPTDLTRRILVERYLDWHHLGLRKACMGLTFAKVIAPRLQKTVTPEEIRQAEREVGAALKLFDSVWLKNTPYLAGDLPSVADLSATCELEQLRLLQWDFSSRPNLVKYLASMEKLTGFEEVHRILFKSAERTKAAPQSKL